MAIEIERKFLVNSTDFIDLAFYKKNITQGYISKSKEANVRVRLIDNIGFITIKGKSNDNGISRYEWEHEISKEDAIELLEFCKGNIIKKTRYLVDESSGLTYEVDVFKGENEGLIIAEIELVNKNQEFDKPHWLGAEVTGIKKYYNSYISLHPFDTW